MALEEQIASKQLQRAALEEQFVSKNVQQVGRSSSVPPPSLSDAAPPASERGMGQRYGGPMAPTQKDRYASDLRAQIEAREVRRAADADAAREAREDGLFGPGAREAPLAGRRRHGAPPLPSKESYKMELEKQMAMRNVQKAAEAMEEHTPRVDEEGDALDELFGKGRCHNKFVPPAKSLYAAELQQQIAARKAQQAAEEGQPLPLGGFPGSGVNGEAFSAQREQARGKRQVSDAVSKASHGAALQEQMAERAAHRAARAFHVQAPYELEAALPGQQDISKAGGRRNYPQYDVAPETKESYAQALANQIAERKAQQDRLMVAGPQKSSFVGGDAYDAREAMRGRRHAPSIAPASKQQLMVDLQRQMAERAPVKCQAQAPAYDFPPVRWPQEAAPDEQMRPGKKFFGADQGADQYVPGMRADSLERFVGANGAHVSCGY